MFPFPKPLFNGISIKQDHYSIVLDYLMAIAIILFFIPNDLQIILFGSKINGCEERMEGDTSALMPVATSETFETRKQLMPGGTSETRKQQTVTIISAIVAIIVIFYG